MLEKMEKYFTVSVIRLNVMGILVFTCSNVEGVLNGVPLECVTHADGRDYMGQLNVTELDNPCQLWRKQRPRDHKYTRDRYFPDLTVEDAEDHCRNPELRTDAGNFWSWLWCYNGNSKVKRKWDLCGNRTRCEECLWQPDGVVYAGTRDNTTSGLTCQRWDSQTPHPHPYTEHTYFPDSTLTFAENYCRNPNSTREGVWCYTADPAVEWEYCDVPLCYHEKTTKEKTSLPITTVKATTSTTKSPLSTTGKTMGGSTISTVSQNRPLTITAHSENAQTTGEVSHISQSRGLDSLMENVTLVSDVTSILGTDKSSISGSKEVDDAMVNITLVSDKGSISESNPLHTTSEAPKITEGTANQNTAPHITAALARTTQNRHTTNTSRTGIITTRSSTPTISGTTTPTPTQMFGTKAEDTMPFNDSVKITRVSIKGETHFATRNAAVENEQTTGTSSTSKEPTGKSSLNHAKGNTIGLDIIVTPGGVITEEIIGGQQEQITYEFTWRSGKQQEVTDKDLLPVYLTVAAIVAQLAIVVPVLVYYIKYM